MELVTALILTILLGNPGHRVRVRTSPEHVDGSHGELILGELVQIVHHHLQVLGSEPLHGAAVLDSQVVPKPCVLE